MTILEKILNSWHDGFYSEPFMIIAEAIALIICTIKRRKEKIGRILLLYIGFDFSLLILDEYLKYFSNYQRNKIIGFIDFTNELISIVELMVYYYYFLQILQNHLAKLLIRILRILFLLISTFFIAQYYTNFLLKSSIFSYYFAIIEFIFLLSPCLIYYYELFSIDPIYKLFERPSFWITTGIMFYSFASIPFYSTVNFFRSNLELKHMYVFFYLPFAINFLFLTKGFLCKNKLTI